MLIWLLCGRDSVPPGDDWLSPHERERLSGMRLPKRRGDFRLGRWTAKLAVRGALGDSMPLTDIDVRAAPDGAPEVFLPGGPARVAVSIAHSGGRALAVVGPRSVAFGADLETIEDRSAAFVEGFFTASERDWLSAVEPSRRGWAATLVWSAKEAVLKAMRTGLREDTRAVELAIDEPAAGDAEVHFRPIRASVASVGRSFAGWAAETAGQVMTVMSEGTSAGPLRGITESAVWHPP